MIDKVIILSRKINAISEGAENLYYRIYVNTDDFGLFHADPEILKGQIYTLRKDISVVIIKKRLDELIEIELIKIYKHNDERYLEIVDFEKHQTFRKDYICKYEYPKPNTKSYEVVRNHTKSPTNINKIKLNEIKLNEEGTITNITSDQELQIDKELKTVKGISKKKRGDIICYLRELSIEFPDIDYVEEIKKKVAWWRDHPLTKRSNIHLQLRNWFIISQKGFNEAQKQQGVGKDHSQKKTKYPGTFLHAVYQELQKQSKELSDYSDKMFALTDEEAEEAARNFQPTQFIKFLEEKK